MVITSNRSPIDLYKNGLNRDLFLPFISFIEANFDVFEVSGVKDYRQTLIAGDKVYFSPLNLENRDCMDLIWSNLTGNSSHEFTLTFKGREIRFLFIKMALLGLIFLRFVGRC